MTVLRETPEQRPPDAGLNFRELYLNFGEL